MTTGSPRTLPWEVFEPLELDPILRAALDAFNEQGFHGAPVREIAARVGVAVPTLYYHHGSKQGLLLALLRVSMTDLTARTELALTEAGDDPVDRVADLVDCTARFMCHRQRLAWLDAQMRYLDDAAREVYAAPRKAFELRWLGELSAGTDTGALEVDHPVDTTRALLGTLQSIATWYRPDGELDPAEIGARHVAFALDALRVTPARRDRAVERSRSRPEPASHGTARATA